MLQGRSCLKEISADSFAREPLQGRSANEFQRGLRRDAADLVTALDEL